MKSSRFLFGVSGSLLWLPAKLHGGKVRIWFVCPFRRWQQMTRHTVTILEHLTATSSHVEFFLDWAVGSPILRGHELDLLYDFLVRTELL